MVKLTKAQGLLYEELISTVNLGVIYTLNESGKYGWYKINKDLEINYNKKLDSRVINALIAKGKLVLALEVDLPNVYKVVKN